MLPPVREHLARGVFYPKLAYRLLKLSKTKRFEGTADNITSCTLAWANLPLASVQVSSSARAYHWGKRKAHDPRAGGNDTAAGRFGAPRKTVVCLEARFITPGPDCARRRALQRKGLEPKS